MANPAFPALLAATLFAMGALLWLFVAASFLLWGARLAGIERRSFGRAIGAILLGGIASSILAGMVGISTAAGPLLGVLLGFCVSALVTMAIFDTTFGKALAANVLAWLLSIVVAVAFSIFGGILIAFFAAAAA